MRRTFSFRFSIFSAIFSAIFVTLSVPAAAQQRTPQPAEFISWLPISDAERAQKSPSVEKDAGAEVLLWRVRVVDEVLGDRASLQRVFYNYVRVKVFDEKGKEKVSTVDLAYRDPGTIMSVAARTIKADGSILELDQSAIHRHDLIRAGHLREKAVSFAIPGVEPGAIVEYRWRQTEDDNRFRYVRLHFQRDLPVEKVTYYVKPLDDVYVRMDTMYMLPFHCRPAPIKLDSEGWDETSVENLPALRTEPYSPSEPNVEQWALLYYRANDTRDSKKFWNAEGKKTYHELKDSFKLTEELKAAAKQEIAGADPDKLARLATYVRRNIRELGDPEITQAQIDQYIAKYPKDRERNAAEIFKSGVASAKEMNVALAALALSVGIDARVALVADRTEVAFNPEIMLDTYFLGRSAVAVRDGESWRFLDASQKLVAPGSLAWEEEGVSALIIDPKEPVFVTTPYSKADSSVDQNSAAFHLHADGSLEGNVEEQYTGHRAEEYRSELRNRPAAQQEEWFRDRISRMFPESDMTDFKISDAENPANPLRVSYHLKAPGFAQVTGKRLLFQPNVFRRAQGTLFTASDRSTPVEFPYAWKEVDRIQIMLPDGYSVDNAESMGNLSFGPAISYKVNMSYSAKPPLLWTTTREFSFGDGGNLYAAPANYPALKRIFDAVRTRDTLSISLKVN